jgi:hypothetical protein
MINERAAGCSNIILRLLSCPLGATGELHEELRSEYAVIRPRFESGTSQTEVGSDIVHMIICIVLVFSCVNTVACRPVVRQRSRNKQLYNGCY